MLSLSLLLLKGQKRLVTTLSGMQYAALKYSLNMPHLPVSPMTLYINGKIEENANLPQLGLSFKKFIHQWEMLPEGEMAKFQEESDAICKEYYQCLDPGAASNDSNDRIKLVKEIILKHSKPNFEEFGLSQQALVDALPPYVPEMPMEKYFQAVSAFVNQMNTFKTPNE